MGVAGEAAVVHRRHPARALDLGDHVDDRRVRVVNSLDQHSVETGSPTGDGSGVDDTAGTDDPARSCSASTRSDVSIKW